MSSILILMIILAAIISIARTPAFKGFIGELIVNVLSSLLLDKKEYKLLRNVTLPTDDGSTQIDHVIVSKFGIFVVETKNLKGWIYGSEKQRIWTQVLYKTKTKFQNPLHQNYKHVKTLERLLGLSADCFHPVVVFMGDCTFKTPMPGNVVFPLDYVSYIESKTIYRLEESQVDDVAAAIEKGRFERSWQTHVDHVQHVKKVVSEKQNLCPRCGRPLVVRTAKKGPNTGKKFLGCSGFPACKYTAQVEKRDGA